MHRCVSFAMILCAFVVGCGETVSPLAGGKDADEWIEMATDNDPKVRMKAIQKLGNIGPRDSRGIETIIAALDDPARDVRKVAIFAIVRIGSPCRSAYAKLEEMGQEDPDSEIQKLASEAHENLNR